jgi:hypothetical protein
VVHRGVDAPNLGHTAGDTLKSFDLDHPEARETLVGAIVDPSANPTRMSQTPVFFQVPNA